MLLLPLVDEEYEEKAKEVTTAGAMPKTCSNGRTTQHRTASAPRGHAQDCGEHEVRNETIHDGPARY